jgi:hypothetical protein
MDDIHELTTFENTIICVTSEGEFYCNPLTNSTEYDDKLISFFSLRSLKEFISKFKDTLKNDKFKYYIFDVDNLSINKVKAIDTSNGVICLTDGSNAWEIDMFDLYDLSIENHPAFYELSNTFTSIKMHEDHINKLKDDIDTLAIKANNILDSFPMTSDRSFNPI